MLCKAHIDFACRNQYDYTKKTRGCKGGEEVKDTNNLRQELMEAANLDQFLSENQENFNSGNVCDLLNQIFQKRKLSKAALAKQSGMSEVYLHQVFSGRRNPSRSRLLCLCFGLNATLEETQELLKQCGLAQLYPKNKRDAIILYGILNGMDLFALNDKLCAENEETLY